MARRIAFLIGNQTFRPESGLPPLQGPANDIAALTRLLGDPDRGKFEVHEFLDKTRQDIMNDIAEALDSAATGDLLLIYYSGHGILDRGGRLCLVTTDTRRGDALTIASSIPARYLSDLVDASNCDQVVLILDCCFSGAVDGLRGDVGTALQVVEQAHGFYIITATTNMQTAREEAPTPGGVIMGKFSATLVNGIESGAADRDRKGKILLSDLRRYLEQAVTGSTPQFFDRRADGDPLISLSPATAATPLAARIDFLVNHVLQSPVHGERLYALQQLHAIGPDAAEAVPILIRVLKDPNAEFRGRAVDVLRDIGPAAANAVPTLAETLKDETLRWRAVEALQRIGPAAVPALAEALKDQDAHVRSLATCALRDIGPAAAEAVPALAEALKDQDGTVSRCAVEALQRIGPAAVPALAEALKDQSAIVRSLAADALKSIREKPLVFAHQP